MELVGEEFVDVSIPVGYGIAGVGASVVFFGLLNLFARFVGPPSTVNGNESVWRWRNLAISWVHAAIVGTWTLSCFFIYPELMSDLVGYYNMYIYSMVAFSTGYFMYDFIDIMIDHRLLSSWEVVIHHVLVATMFSAHLIQCHCVAYTAVALLAEVNTIFLHARKLLQILRVPFTSWLYRVNSAANIATFVGCRFLCLVWITHGIVVYRNVVGPGYWIAISTSTFIMSIINIVLFWRLLCSDCFRTHKSRVQNPRSDINGVAPVKVSALKLNESEAVLANGHTTRRRNLSNKITCASIMADSNDWAGKRLAVESHLPDLDGLKQLCYHGTENVHLTRMHLDFDGVLG